MESLYARLAFEQRVHVSKGKREAWLVSTEGLAYKLAFLLEKRGFRIGQDIQIARFGIDPPWVQTGLLGLRQPHRALGKKATELLIRLSLEHNSLSEKERYIELPIEIDESEHRTDTWLLAK
ncbi:hypothetical protein MASR2M78_10660 [Treponema sp.]